MQKKTVYLAGKITGDPFYRSKFYEAQKKLEEGGFIVVNPALLPSEGFTWEAYMRMAGAMLNECAEVCFLPDWTESRGAKFEFGEAVAQKKPFFFFNDWEAKQNAENNTPPLPVPTEAEEQIALFEWAALQSGRFPELALLYHVPNGGSRNKIEAARLRAQGVKSGVPDLCLPVARGGNHGLYIELKRQRGGRISEEQVRWINGLLKQGYAAAICKGWQEAANVIIDYLQRKTEG